MSRKNNKAKYNRMLDHYKKDEKERMDKNKKRNEARLKNIKLKEEGRYVDPAI